MIMHAHTQEYKNITVHFTHHCTMFPVKDWQVSFGAFDGASIHGDDKRVSIWKEII